ncbi:hypothetical protein QBC41DRAFT_310580 [Cercophora samala]|uniref:Uncharacterized protein n=1 Tax=Cercophora samala TaxID=330535 RepID=A0AA39ZMH0_9PEZI|nr:hypothetical protein QBC41DRAFT_310580 [Cercophora samala]
MRARLVGLFLFDTPFFLFVLTSTTYYWACRHTHTQEAGSFANLPTYKRPSPRDGDYIISIIPPFNSGKIKFGGMDIGRREDWWRIMIGFLTFCEAFFGGITMILGYGRFMMGLI